METQMDAIRKHFEDGKSLTSMEAFRLYGCTRLSDKVFRMKKQGYLFRTETVKAISQYGFPCQFAKYSMVGKVNV